MTCLSNFYTASMNDSDSLTTFVSKITKFNNSINDIGDAKIKFTDPQIIGKIVSAIPPTIPRFQTLLQSIHQIDKDTLTLELLKDMFMAEDKRVENLKGTNRQTANQLKPQEKKPIASKPRKCIEPNCKFMIPGEVKSHITKCTTCWKKSQEKNKQKAGSALALSTSDKPTADDVL